MIALLDGDMFAYRCAASSENDPEEVAIWRTNIMMEECLNEVKADEFRVFLSCHRTENFRRKIYPEYKANRTKPDPVHLKATQELLIEKWNAVRSVDQEADDEMGIAQCAGTGKTIICSNDKDMLMIPGDHFNVVKKQFIFDISYLDGIKHFYKQSLIGDRADNIFGVRGIGEVKAGNIINECETEAEMFQACLDKYNNDRERLVMNLKVLWIRRKPNEIWEAPVEGTDNEEWAESVNFCN